MAKYKRYEGEFLSVGGVVNRVEIWQENNAAFTVGELSFPADSPLTIEWGEKGKEEVLLGSSATLKIISPGDRTYLDLYTVRYGDVRMDVYRDDQIYWRGCIDTEFYEEPYERLDNYDVTLTFCDFGVLDRLPFDLPVSFMSISDVLVAAFTKTKCVRIDSTHISTADVNTTYNLGLSVLTNAYIRTDNFYQEDGTPEKWANVVKGILQPLAVRVTQYRGRIYLYDFNTLVQLVDPPSSLIYQLPYHRNIEWTGDKQTLSIDKTYNNIKITFSPYAQASNLFPSECWPDTIEVSREILNINSLSGRTEESAMLWTYPLKDENPSFSIPGFTLWTSMTAKNVTLEGGRRVFRCVPQYDGDDSEGVAACWYAFRKYTEIHNGQSVYKTECQMYGWNPIDRWDYVPSMLLFTTPHVLVPPQSSESPMQLRVKMNILVDCRINPFEDPFLYKVGGDSTCKAGMDRFNKRAQFLYIPVKIHFKPVGSDVDYVYDNSNVIQHGANVTSYRRTVSGTWTVDEGDSFCWLAYYNADAEERKKGTALCKWVANRQTVDVHGERLDTMLMNLEDGQYIPYPDVPLNPAGEIWIEVMGRGWKVARYDATMGSEDHNKYTDFVKNCLTFALCKLPELEILNYNLFDQELANDDVVYMAESNPDAREELAINTICGTYTSAIPAARGTFYTERGMQIKKMMRAGRLATAEELLCGTLYSQYAERHVCVSGECALKGVRALSFTEPNQPNKKFLAVSEVQDLRTDTMDAKFIEFTEDEYDRR